MESWCFLMCCPEEDDARRDGQPPPYSDRWWLFDDLAICTLQFLILLEDVAVEALVSLYSSSSVSVSCGGGSGDGGGPLQFARLSGRGSIRLGQGWSNGMSVATVCSLSCSTRFLHRLLLVIVMLGVKSDKWSHVACHFFEKMSRRRSERRPSPSATKIE